MEACSYYENPRKANCIINVPSDFVKENMIYLQEIGERRLSSSFTNNGEEASSYLFFIVTDGQGELEYDGASYRISAGYCVFLDCRKTFCYCPVEKDLTVQYIYFAGFHMEEIYKQFIDKGIPCFRSYGPKVYMQEWQHIYDIAASARASLSTARDMEMYAALISLVTNLIKLEENTRVPVRRALHKRDLQSVKEYLDKNYQEKITLDDLSETFFINKFYLTRLFREQYGASVNDYLIQVRLSHAKSLLRSTNMPIKKISSDCGFKNTNYFYKVFRKREGVSPGEFQKLNTNAGVQQQAAEPLHAN